MCSLLVTEPSGFDLQQGTALAPAYHGDYDV